MKTQHTPTHLQLPLKSSQMSAYLIQDANGTNVIKIENLNQQDCYTLESLIVRAVNSHQDLINRLHATTVEWHFSEHHSGSFNDCQISRCMMNRQAIAQAEGK